MSGFFYAIIPNLVFADARVYFSEIAWAGSNISWADEWFELGNGSSSDIDLSNWKITRLSNGEEKDMLVIPSGKIPANGHFLIANYAPPDTILPLTADLVSADVSLANSQLQLKLYDSNGLLVDTADDGVGDPPAGDKQIKASMERILPLADGTLSSSWQTAATPIDPNDLSKGYGTPEVANYPKPVYGRAFIVINEIMPDPNAGDEWIELYNQGDNEVNLTGWQLDDILAGGSKPYTFSGRIIRAGEFLTVTKSTSGIGFNNDGDEVNLVNPEGTVVDHTQYDRANENQVWVRTNERAFVWSSYQTKAQDNRLPERANYNNLVKISEILPNPAGSDEDGEWVELVSASDLAIDLSGWSLDDEEGGSSPYQFESNSILSPHQYFLVNRAQSKIAYNNDSDEVRLFAPDQTLVDSTVYSKVKENESFAYISGIWQWTNQPTFGLENKTSKIAVQNPELLPAPAPNPASGTSSEKTDQAPAKSPVKVGGAIKTAILSQPILIEKTASQQIFPPLIAGAESSKKEPPVLIHWLFFGIIATVCLGVIKLWRRLKLSKSSNGTAKPWHPG